MSRHAAAVVRVALIDDHRMVRESLSSLLTEDVRFEVVAEADDLAAGVELVVRHAPDVAIVDHDLPDGTGVALVEELERGGRRTRILMLSVHESTHYAVRALEAGASGFIVKTAAVEELVEAVLAVRRGQIWLSGEISDDVIDHLRRPRRARTGLEALSPREFELLRALGRGLGLKQAAFALGVSVSTASTYRSRMLEKLGLQHTTELIRFAVEHQVA